MAPRHYYRGSPNYDVSNILLCFAVVLCLWNIWVVPAADELEMPETTSTGTAAAMEASTSSKLLSSPSMSSSSVLSKRKLRQNSYISIYDASLQKRYVLPLQVVDGHSVVAILPQMLATAPLSSRLESPPISKLSSTNHVETSSSQKSIKKQLSTSSSSFVALENPIQPNEDNNRLTYKSNENPSSTVIGHELLPSQRSANNSKSKNQVKLTRHYRHHIHGNYNHNHRHHHRSYGSSNIHQSVIVLLAISGSVVTGAFYAKRALEKMQKWEEQSKEDSLAYDMAYTDTISEVGYGSYVSSAWSDELDKFDV